MSRYDCGCVDLCVCTRERVFFCFEIKKFYKSSLIPLSILCALSFCFERDCAGECSYGFILFRIYLVKIENSNGKCSKVKDKFSLNWNGSIP